MLPKKRIVESILILFVPVKLIPIHLHQIVQAGCGVPVSLLKVVLTKPLLLPTYLSRHFNHKYEEIFVAVSHGSRYKRSLVGTRFNC
jgi:hypothetical protein